MIPRKIITNNVYPPIGRRDCDWEAYYDGDEPNDAGWMLVGRGASEAEAIEDLMELADDVR